MISIVQAQETSVKIESRPQRRAWQRRLQEQYEQRVAEEAGLASQVDAAVRKAAEAAFQQRVEDREREIVGRGKGEHRNYNDATEVDAECGKCHRKQRVMFTRDGTWPRFLTTLYGLIRLRLTRIRCDCGGFVSVCYGDFEPHQRRHEDVNRRMYGLMGMCLSLRQVRLVLGAQGIRISTATVASELGALEDQSQVQFGKGNPAPGVILYDAVWVYVAEETGVVAVNALGQERKQKRVKKKPVLVAWGIWPDTGRTALVGWAVGESEDTASWQSFLESVLERGVKAEHGLRLFVHDGCGGLEAALEMVSFGKVRCQRCVFHKIKNVRDSVQGDPEVPKEKKREHKRERRKAVLEDLSRIWVAASEEEARQREQEFSAKWQEKEPKAVATLRNDFEKTLTFYRVQAEVQAETGQRWDSRYLRTTSLLERKNRTIRAKARAATVFQTENGCMKAAHLALICRGVQESDELALKLASVKRQARAPAKQVTAPIST